MVKLDDLDIYDKSVNIGFLEACRESIIEVIEDVDISKIDSHSDFSNDEKMLYLKAFQDGANFAINAIIHTIESDEADENEEK